jgi:hypothetical protein
MQRVGPFINEFCIHECGRLIHEWGFYIDVLRESSTGAACNQVVVIALCSDSNHSKASNF